MDEKMDEWMDGWMNEMTHHLYSNPRSILKHFQAEVIEWQNKQAEQHLFNSREVSLPKYIVAFNRSMGGL